MLCGRGFAGCCWRVKPELISIATVLSKLHARHFSIADFGIEPVPAANKEDKVSSTSYNWLKLTAATFLSNIVATSLACGNEGMAPALVTVTAAVAEAYRMARSGLHPAASP